MIRQAFQILLVEDDPGDAELTRIGLSRTDTVLELTIVDQGQTALDYLHQQGQFKEALRPHLILLDLNLPGLSGFEVLRIVKQEPDIQAIPVVIFSTSDNQKDIEKIYRLGANCYIQKQSNLKQFMQTVAQVENFWFTTAKLAL